MLNVNCILVRAGFTVDVHLEILVVPEETSALLLDRSVVVILLVQQDLETDTLASRIHTT